MLNKAEVKKNFSRSAPQYERHAQLQKKLADGIFRQAAKLRPKRVLDIGCGTGYLARKLARAFPRAKVVGIDLAPGMIKVAKKHARRSNLVFKVADGEVLKQIGEEFDLVVSNASLQWMRADAVFSAVARQLKPGGLFLFSTFGPATLREMRVCGFRVNSFPSIGQLRDWARPKFRVKGLRSRRVKLTFRSVKELLFHLKELGAQTAGEGKTRRFLSAFKKYRQRYSSGQGVFATFEAIQARLVVI